MKKNQHTISVGRPENMSAEEALVDENFKHALAICSVVFHEMRHLYQKEAVRVYNVTKMLGTKTIEHMQEMLSHSQNRLLCYEV